MRKSLLSRSAGRAFVAVLAVWMTVFAMFETVHRHGPLPQATDHSSLTQPAQGTANQAVCLACVASHTPVQVVGDQVSVPAPQDTAAAILNTHEELLRSELFATLTSRGPPASDIQA
jgi:hypothetical protein